MSFDLFEHQNELVFTNVFGDGYYVPPIPALVTLPDGTEIPAAVDGHPESVTYWLHGSDAAMHEISIQQATAQQLYLHQRYGAGFPDPIQQAALINQGLAPVVHMDEGALRGAVISLPGVLSYIQSNGYTEAQVWDYAVHAAPNIFG